MNLNDLRMSLKTVLDNMWARIDARIHAIEEGGGGGVTSVNGQTGDVSITPANIGAMTTSDVIDIAHGGTGATDAAVTITNNYSSVLNAINAVRNTRIFPISIQKYGTTPYSDMPSGYETNEWNVLLIGNAARMTVLLFIYTDSKIFSRNFYVDHWLTAWSQIN